ncbi:serine/threonine-protein kinase [Kitasatospora herbaricolor]|uniref:non-specific serine/threonine protein kinase n=1 Tax=Kitasatospora herbaricolor TaxID=68217 RepID=A0ABZ1WFV3_9ACTN|nr:serine/threonine-protein kinase [Kitasatospora herbaricolor]
MAETVIEERYTLERLLGKGGMGEVWAGHDRRLRRPVAVKLMRQHGEVGGNGVERFVREAQLTAGLEHPGVPVIYDAGSLGDQRLFLVMQLIRGRTLEQQLAERGPFPVRWAAAVAAQVSEVLAHAHQLKVVHRDLKPGNLMITPSGAIKVLDFGIAAALDADPDQPRLTAAGATPGTPGFIAPEQLLTGKPATEAADLYALGCVLYELLSGKPPFRAPTPLALAYLHAHKSPPPLRELCPHLPRSFADLVTALMAKGPEDRPSSAADVYALASPWASEPEAPARQGRPVAVPAGAVPAPAAPPDVAAMAAAVTITASARAVGQPAGTGGSVYESAYDPTLLYTRRVGLAPQEPADYAVAGRELSVGVVQRRLAELELLAEAGELQRAYDGYTALAGDAVSWLEPDGGPAPTGELQAALVSALLACQSGGARCLAGLGRGDKALKLFVDLLPDQQQVFGVRSPEALATRWEIALLRARAGLVKRAHKELVALRADQLAVLPVGDPAHERTDRMLARLGRISSTGQ